MSGERKERVRKEECVGKVGEIPYTCLFFWYTYDFTLV
jgi:hypothetical protein